MNQAEERGQGLWLMDKRFDLFFFHISGLLCLLFLIPYGFWGAAVILPIYNLYLVLFGLPHNYMTWSSILPKAVRSTINMRAVILPAIVCLLICLALPFVQGHAARDWILTLITLASLWHAYRQHHGICKIYDAVQSKRTGDRTIFEDRKASNIFFFLGIWLVVVWAFSHEEIKYLLSADDFYRLIYPRIPQGVYYAYVAVTICAGIWAAKRLIWDRWRRGAFIPWPQISLMTIALMTYLVPYAFVPLSAMPLAVAIATIYHNIQYFGFVWLFERNRVVALSQKGTELQYTQKVVLRGNWKTFAGLGLTYSLFMTVIYLASPMSFGLVLLYYIAFAHYIIDGIIWRRHNNAYVGEMVQNLVSGHRPHLTADLEDVDDSLAEGSLMGSPGIAT